MVESVVLLALAVLLFRTFAAEGYLISTGSMAPTLLGYHRQVECPACHFAFSRGAAFDPVDPSTGRSGTRFVSANLSSEADIHAETICPNCLLEGIDARHAPRNEGDQLLVQKLAFEFRDPHRWEVVVFRNREKSTQAYVKRVAGLPGEEIEIRDGDLYANGELQRKPFEIQSAVRIPVADYHFRPVDDDPDWRSRWRTDDAGSGWKLDADTISLERANKSNADSVDWMLYEHWIRVGGDHITHVPLKQWPQELEIPTGPHLIYEDGELICVGVLTEFERRRLTEQVDAPNFVAALNSLFEQSHVGPITDAYGYNAHGQRKQFTQHDLMVSVSLSQLSGPGQFEVQMTDGADLFRVAILPASRQIGLFRNGDSEPIWTRELPPSFFDESSVLDVSLFDQQAVVAVNGEPVAEPYRYEAAASRHPLRRPVRIGATQIDCVIDSLKLYRDVYYTQKPRESEDRFQLADDEFFVLGDNSPVSVDSRVWEQPAVPRSALIGKPFLVHLPSKQEEFWWKGKVTHVRVPDFSRIRYIR